MFPSETLQGSHLGQVLYVDPSYAISLQHPVYQSEWLRYNKQTLTPNDSLKSFLAEQPSLRRYQALRI